MKYVSLLAATLLFLAACGGNHDYAPKPRGYYRIAFPKKNTRIMLLVARMLLHIPSTPL
ncbi:hypothetical protein ACFJIV_26595 [Mucilaginibacter sp. UC70_90]